jgi:hypothetical protein
MSPHDSESDIDVLDGRFPIDITDSLGTYESAFWEEAHLRPDRACIDRLVMRARADPRWRRRFSTPITPADAYQYAQQHDADDDTHTIHRVELAHDDQIDTQVGALVAAWNEEDQRPRRNWPRRAIAALTGGTR